MAMPVKGFAYPWRCHDNFADCCFEQSTPPTVTVVAGSTPVTSGTVTILRPVPGQFCFPGQRGSQFLGQCQPYRCTCSGQP